MPGSGVRHAPAKKRVDTERRERGVVVQVGDARKRSAERSELEWKNAIADDGDARSRVVSNSGGARRDHHGIARGTGAGATTTARDAWGRRRASRLHGGRAARV